MSKYLNFFDNNILLLFIYFFNFITLRVNFEILDTLLIFCFIFKKKKQQQKKKRIDLMKRYLFLLLLILLIFNRVDFIKYALNDEEEKTMATRKITLGAGCFWCVETSFRRLRGVSSAISGYSGGHTPNPTYEQVN